MVVFVDDILIYSKIPEEHALHLWITLQMLREHQLFAKREKCKFWMSEVKFLGHVVSRENISVDPAKIEAVFNWERSKNVCEIRSFLSLAGYYRRFMEGFSRVAAPMTRLTQKDVRFDWKDACEVAFQELKMRLTTLPVLIVPTGGEHYVVYAYAS